MRPAKALAQQNPVCVVGFDSLEPNGSRVLAPSTGPSTSPSTGPSTSPTGVPTGIPTALPSGKPTALPSGVPTPKPTPTPVTGGGVGKITEYAVSPGADRPTALAFGADGAVWFTAQSNTIGRMTTTGTVTNDFTPAGYVASLWTQSMIMGPDHLIWFTSTGASALSGVNRIASDGTVTNVAVTNTGKHGL